MSPLDLSEGVMKTRAFVLAVIAVGAVGAHAQTRSSFLEVDAVSQIAVDVSNSNLTYKVSLGANPTFTYQNTVYTITDLIGFWNLSDDDDLTVTNSDIGVWQANNSNSGVGGIAGWKTQPNTGITPGQDVTLTYDALSW